MPKKKDENETAFNALQEILRRDQERDGLPVDLVPEEEKLSYRVEAGRKGGRIGGHVRKEKLTPEKRKKIARKAAKARWNKKT